MWGVPRAADVGTGAKLKATVRHRRYGQAEPRSTAVSRTAPRACSASRSRPILATICRRAAIADAIDWFGRTIGAPRAIAPMVQIWRAKEIGTGLALIGLAILSFALFDLLLATSAFAGLRGEPRYVGTLRGGPWWTLALATAFVPALSLYLLILGIPPPLILSRLFPQGITDWLMVWAIANAAIGLAIGYMLRRQLRPTRFGRLASSAGLALLVVGALYLIVLAASVIPLDFRFWVVALRPLPMRLIPAWLVYLLPFGLFLLIGFRGLDALLGSVRTLAARRLVAMAVLAGGFLVVTGVQYLALFATGALPLSFEALNAIVAIQFVPLLAGLALLAVHSRERTGSVLTGALIGTLFVTWYMVAGTATHVAV